MVHHEGLVVFSFTVSLFLRPFWIVAWIFVWLIFASQLMLWMTSAILRAVLLSVLPVPPLLASDPHTVRPESIPLKPIVKCFSCVASS